MARSSTTFDGKNYKGGRPKGLENKVTKDAKERFMEIMEGEIENVKSALSNVRKENESQYLNLLSKLLPYFLPKKVDVSSNGKDINGQPVINVSGLTDEQLDRLTK